MKCLLFLIFIGSFGQCSLAFCDNTPTNYTNVSAREYIWFENWDEGIQAAQNENKPILIEFVKDNCYTCKKMALETFSDTEIMRILADNWICIRINISNWEKMRGTVNGKIMNYYEIATYYKVTGFVTLVFLNKNEEPFHIIKGFVNKEQLKIMLNNYAIEENQTLLRKQYLKATDDPSNLFSIILLFIIISLIIASFPKINLIKSPPNKA